MHVISVSGYEHLWPLTVAMHDAPGMASYHGNNSSDSDIIGMAYFTVERPVFLPQIKNDL